MCSLLHDVFVCFWPSFRAWMCPVSCTRDRTLRSRLLRQPRHKRSLAAQLGRVKQAVLLVRSARRAALGPHEHGSRKKERKRRLPWKWTNECPEGVALDVDERMPYGCLHGCDLSHMMCYSPPSSKKTRKEERGLMVPGMWMCVLVCETCAPWLIMHKH